MMRRIGLVICLMAFAGLVRAEECVVSVAGGSADLEGSLPALIVAVTERGACLTNDAGLREEYKDLLGMAQEFHVIRWRQSMEIRLVGALPSLHGYGGNPLILRAEPGVQVRVVGNGVSSVLMDGGGGEALIDGVTLSGFPAEAVTIRSDGNGLIRARVIDSGQDGGDDPFAQQPGILIVGGRTHLRDVEVANNRGPGIIIREKVSGVGCQGSPFTIHHPPSTAVAVIEQSVIHHNRGVGIAIDAPHVTLSENQVFENGASGVLVRTASAASRCAAEAHQPVPDTAWHTAFLQRNRFWQNGGAADPAIRVTQYPLMPPVDLVVVSAPAADTMVLVGNVSRVTDPAYPWHDGVIDFSALRVEIYLADTAGSGEGRHFLTAIDRIDPVTRQFFAYLPAPIVVEGSTVDAPVFTATVVDTENRNTSPFAAPLDVAGSVDWDGDGIPNTQEDLNRDGSVDVGESDPRLADSDGDGLTDGEERLLLGRLATRAESRQPLADPRRLDPRNADSDGDCLPDGVETGIARDDLPEWKPAAGSVLQRPRMQLSPACEEALRRHGVLSFANALPLDPAQSLTTGNIAALYDLDPLTRTDPTSQDTDRDGVADGAEDWNLDGARTGKNPSAVVGRQSSENPLPVNSESGAKVEGRGSESTSDLAPRTSDQTTSPQPPVDAVKVATLVLKSTSDQRPATSDAVWIETDPTRADSDGDGLLDGEEGDRNADGTLEASETDPLRADTDDDGVDDATEIRKFGSLPNQCDSDGDGLGDGVEAGVMHPHPVRTECLGLQTAGSNFASIGALQPVNPDSDNDGLPDGKEDTNYNGWLDAHETDPTTGDTDRDGIGDYFEMTGDLDRDGIADVTLAKINNGAKCAPPPTFDDLDCDGLPNAADDDADNDGCSDRDEGVDPEGDPNGLPAAFNGKVKACVAAKSPASGGGGGTSPAPSTSSPPTTTDPNATYFSEQLKGGGGCSLLP